MGHCNYCGAASQSTIDMDHICEELWTCKPSQLKGLSLDRFYKELENLCLACPVGCHIRDPRQSLRYQKAHTMPKRHNLNTVDSDGNTEDEGDDYTQDDGNVDSDGNTEDDDIQRNKRVRYARACNAGKKVYSSASITHEYGSDVYSSDGD